MMGKAPAMNEGATNINPRRLPAHVSVSLRHGDSNPPRSIQQPPTKEEKSSSLNPSKAHKSSEESEATRESTVLDAKAWFDKSNRRAQTELKFEGNEPPFFPRANSSASDDEYQTAANNSFSHAKFSYLRHGPVSGKGSSTDDYRSVIDDLTVENKKLRKRLRKLERLHSTHLQKDKLFEVQIHALPASKRRELEDTLRAFTSSLDDSSEEANSKHLLDASQRSPALQISTGSGPTPKHGSSLGGTTSTSRPVDSGYASISNSGPSSNAHVNTGRDGRLAPVSQMRKDARVEKYLQDIPAGFLPSQSPMISERQKKKIVVLRLEQLFTGRRSSLENQNSQLMQQQEVSRSAARAEHDAANRPGMMEGVREANILPYSMDLDAPRHPSRMDDTTRDSAMSNPHSNSAEDSSPDKSSLDQRPTRPLDLDPDRTQIPAENVEYIRHLGLSTPHLSSEDSTDSADADGWIYLNLLINMAQLHIINVTPDFVRSAVADVSEKFQLSRDGKRVRWKGGMKGTRLSSDGSLSSGADQISPDANSSKESRKRRKVGPGLFASVPIEARDPSRHSEHSGQRQQDSFQYKPLFHHQETSSMELTSDESDLVPPKPENALKKKQKNPDYGPIAYYAGAKFCTDLSGDRGNLSTPLHVIGGGNGSGDDTQFDKISFSRTDSGSSLPFRPFEKPPIPAFDDDRPGTPELLRESREGTTHAFSAESRRLGNKFPELQNFEASGLGGTQPADHFALRVETKRTVQPSSNPTKLSKFSNPGINVKKFAHVISRKNLDTFSDSGGQGHEEGLSKSMASLVTSSPPSTPSYTESPIKTEVMSTTFIRLQPSQLPPPTGWYDTSSASDDSDTNSSGLRMIRIRHLGRHSPSSRDDGGRGLLYEPNLSSGELEDDEEEDEVSESSDSVDMLATARRMAPDLVAAQEYQFEMEEDQFGAADEEEEEAMADVDAAVRSSAATVDEASELSMVGSSSDEA